MGSYNQPNTLKEQKPGTVLEAIQYFVASLFGAEEVERLNLERMKENKDLPLSFFLINTNIDQVISALRRKYPEQCPPMVENIRKENCNK